MLSSHKETHLVSSQLEDRALEEAIDNVVHTLCAEADKPQFVHDIAQIVKNVILDIRKIANATERKDL